VASLWRLQNRVPIKIIVSQSSGSMIIFTNLDEYKFINKSKPVQQQEGGGGRSVDLAREGVGEEKSS